MEPAHHDTLVYRLAQMLVKLNQGEKLDPVALAGEFGVNIRTIQRDLNERFAYLPLERVDGTYRLDPAFLGRLSTKDIERFAGLAGIRGLFPSLSDEFLRDIFDARIQTALLVKGHHYEDLAGKAGQFKLVEQAIVGRWHLSFSYRKEGETPTNRLVAPFRLVNNKGIWYLAAREGERLKSFAFTRMDLVRLSDTHFPADPELDRRLAEEEGVWLNEEQREVVIKVSAEVAHYFTRRKLIANQVIEKHLEDGGLILSAKVGHQNQVLPIIRYWVPHLRIISPEGWQQELERGLAGYLNEAL